eukprot:g65666.t1
MGGPDPQRLYLDHPWRTPADHFRRNPYDPNNPKIAHRNAALMMLAFILYVKSACDAGQCPDMCKDPYTRQYFTDAECASARN